LRRRCKAPPLLLLLASLPGLTRQSINQNMPFPRMDARVKPAHDGSMPPKAVTNADRSMTDTPQPAKTPPPQAPQGELSLRTLAMPADTNQNGDIFGGWLLSQMDIAGGMYVGKVAQCRSVTVAIEAMTFRKPVFVGDVVSVYVDSIRVGHTSITVRIEAWVSRRNEVHTILVTDGNFTYVAIDDQGKPQPIKVTQL
jgi:acyl-CoA thioesterase YciA